MKVIQSPHYLTLLVVQKWRPVVPMVTLKSGRPQVVFVMSPLKITLRMFQESPGYGVDLRSFLAREMGLLERMT